MNNIGLVKSSFIPRKDNSKKRLKIVQNNIVLCFELIFNHHLILKYAVFIITVRILIKYLKNHL
jgi:hypothetical protein